MKSCGIVAEYNPFHNGHAYHIQQAKKHSHSDIIVAIMSGNFVQRGEPAIIDKWTRTKEALSQGVDVVVELPSVFALQSADYFALGAMKIATALQLDSLSFGVEQATVTQLKLAGSESLQTQKDFSKSFSQQWATQQPLSKTPNNQLAISYTRALQQLDSDIALVPIQRIHGQHFDNTLSKQSSFASGTAIRHAVLSNDTVQQYVSEFIATQLSAVSKQFHLTSHFIGEQSFWQLLKYRIIISTVQELQQIYQMNEGIEYAMKKWVHKAVSYDDFIVLLQNKRWNRAKIQRLCCYIVLQFKTEWVKQQFKHDIQHIRVLGMTKKGNDFMKTRQKISVVTQLKKQHLDIFSHQINCDNIYRLLTNAPEQNFRRIVLSYAKNDPKVQK